ncbi:HD domain-containing protein [Exiguobacterium sp. s163]|uniref:HD domain-containing protein n=1 Tax=Exiguobacterium sp. s163 TaxID=2751287 RepID=UPI001BE5247C|nr:HD domain-containing protein [Exiguobacterium sp. s163]
MSSKLSSRVKFLKTVLSVLGHKKALKALNLMIQEMCSEKGYSRHDGSHYYLHLVDVTMKIFNSGIRDEDILTTAILHDAIEDVEWINYDFIKREFGKEVADDVLILTKNPDIDYKQDEAALFTYLNQCFSSPSTAIVKTADRIHNFNTLGNADTDKQLRVANDTEKNFFPMFKFARNEYPEYAPFFYQAKTEIEPHLLKIKESCEMERVLRQEIAKLQEEVKSLSITFEEAL